MKHESECMVRMNAVHAHRQSFRRFGRAKPTAKSIADWQYWVSQATACNLRTPTESSQIRTDEATRDQIDQIAEELQCNRNWVINEAIENYLALHRWQVERIHLGLDEMKTGLGVPHEEVFARLECRRRARENQSSSHL